MFYLYPNNDGSFKVYTEIPSGMFGFVEIEKLPEGDGKLKRHEDGSFYYEPIVEEETLEQKIIRLEEKIEQFNLINTDISLTVYEEVLTLRDEIAALKGTSGNV